MLLFYLKQIHNVTRFLSSIILKNNLNIIENSKIKNKNNSKTGMTAKEASNDLPLRVNLSFYPLNLYEIIYKYNDKIVILTLKQFYIFFLVKKYKNSSFF